MGNEISTTVGEELEKGPVFHGSVPAANGFVYCIPFIAPRVMKFDPVSKSMTHIGRDFGGGFKWYNGAMNDRGIIYCVPYNDRGILKVDTNTDTVTELNRDLLPEQGGEMWKSCALALDGCIYFMPDCARRIMKLDPNNNDAMSSVGDDLGGGWKYSGTVVGNDGCVYGIPGYSKRIIKYDPINDTTAIVGEKSDRYLNCSGDGTLARDGCIYAVTEDGQILQIDTTNNFHCLVWNSVESEYDQISDCWGDAILGIDGCVYWTPKDAGHVLKYDPHTKQASLVGFDFGDLPDKWFTGSLASDGVIYCIPCDADRFLSIDPWKEFTSSMKENMEKQPEELGYIFHPSDDMPNETNFDRAITKFGYKQVMKVLEDCLPPADRLCKVSNLYPFMLAASWKESDISLIYQLLRKVPSLVSCFRNHVSHNIYSGKKRKQHNIP